MTWSQRNIKRLKLYRLRESIENYIEEGGKITIIKYKIQPGRYYYPVYPMPKDDTHNVPVLIDIEDL